MSCATAQTTKINMSCTKRNRATPSASASLVKKIALFCATVLACTDVFFTSPADQRTSMLHGCVEGVKLQLTTRSLGQLRAAQLAEGGVILGTLPSVVAAVTALAHGTAVLCPPAALVAAACAYVALGVQCHQHSVEVDRERQQQSERDSKERADRALLDARVIRATPLSTTAGGANPAAVVATAGRTEPTTHENQSENWEKKLDELHLMANSADSKATAERAGLAAEDPVMKAEVILREAWLERQRKFKF